MSTTDALLFAEQATTSLYERVGDRTSGACCR